MIDYESGLFISSSQRSARRKFNLMFIDDPMYRTMVLTALERRLAVYVLAGVLVGLLIGMQ
jgi:hypothetical protein